VRLVFKKIWHYFVNLLKPARALPTGTAQSNQHKTSSAETSLQKESSPSVQPKIYITGSHDIQPNLIDSDALYVLKKLKKAGFIAYLVGGSVRDLLVGRAPKDYDISTSALPEQVKQVFGRSCLLIGRRFRLAHIRFGRKVIEVATFRSGDNEGDLIVRDNQWGTPEEDALRRDFTINGLFYDPESHSIIDYIGGWEDIHKRLIRTIGNPIIRYKQDPVRMIRLLRFKARFGFTVESGTEQALFDCKKEIVKSSPARLLEEILRMLESGASSPFFRLMKEYGFLQIIFPLLDRFFKEKKSHAEQVFQLLASADKIQIAYGLNTLERPIIASCLLFPIVEEEIKMQFLKKGETPHMGEIMSLTSNLIKDLVCSAFSHFPRRISALMAFILATQYRLIPLSGKIHHRQRLVTQRDFPLALKFLKLRSLVNPELVEHYNSWKQFYRQHRQHGERRRSSPSPEGREAERKRSYKKRDRGHV
jgi:poly(A) polymerase